MKRIVVFGATGPTGRQVVELGERSGHKMTAFVRSPDKAQFPASVDVAQGDAFDREAVSAAVVDKDVVVVVLGPPSVGFTKVGSEGTGNVVDAMQRAGVRRLIVQTGHGVGDSFRRSGPLQQLMYRTFLKQNYADKLVQENLVRASELDWTIIRPTVLTNRRPRKSTKADENMRTWLLPSVPRANVAAFILDSIDDKSKIRKVLSVT